MPPYNTSLQHILAELERIDLLVRAQVRRAQQLQGGDEYQGFYISEQELQALLERSTGLPAWATEPGPLALQQIRSAMDQMAADITQRKAESASQGVELRLVELARIFRLTPLDVDSLLICLAPELDLHYERLYAYLQDDVNRKRPSVDLVLNLLCPTFEDKVAARQRFASSAPLLNHHLLHLFDEPGQQQMPLLRKCLKLDERVVNYLLDDGKALDTMEPRLLPYVQQVAPKVRMEDLRLPLEMKRRLALLVRTGATENRPLILYFQGAYGLGRRTVAEALCRELGVNLLVVDGERLLQTEAQAFGQAVNLIMREARLQKTAIYWTGYDALLGDERRSWCHTLLRTLEDREGVTFLAGNVTWEPVETLRQVPFVRIEFPKPSYEERIALWKGSLNDRIQPGIEIDPVPLAVRFRFSGGQIQDAVVTARNLARWRDPENGQVTMDELYAACRLQSNRSLEALAQKITPHYTWDDIVLPPDRLAQLREVCNYVKYRAVVYDGWGFDHKLALGKGLNVLFAGPSGTGKTMAAEIIAAELRLDLYKIDLSTVVSKYIGETEKNLADIFKEAETSNAILFFDEADALFGKRSEVKDAHDRYANLEISYLLQRMEEYEGVVILATNLRKNMDDAFVRRMHFSVEFPFPGERYRRRIWAQIWPDATPCSPDLDLDFLARHLEISGGNIRNVALAAAFLAAGDGQIVEMPHIIHAAKREYQKMGKVVAANEFGEYAGPHSTADSSAGRNTDNDNRMEERPPLVAY
jgi:SpoVK/Ycf46/Vps4 family AAA+-type ATPase